MALNPQQFQQLPMFMTAQEIMDQTNPGDLSNPTPSATKKFWAGKRRAARETPRLKNGDFNSGAPTLSDSIRDEGVRRPLELGWASTLKKPELVNGHHRLAMAVAHDPDQLVPVIHGDGTTPWTQTRHSFGWHD